MMRTALTLLALSAAAFTGCGWNRAATTTINYEFSGQQMLHVATVPRSRPDGSPTDEARKALLDEIAGRGGSYTYAEEAVGFLLRMEDGSMRTERADLLILPGPPMVNPYLVQMLQPLYGSAEPIVAAIPAASPAAVPVSSTTSRQRRQPPRSE